jgi:hypothetical protein
MTKKQFIWLVIRFVGFAYLFMAVPAVLMLGNRVWNLIKSYPYDQPATYFFSYVMIDQASASAATIAMTIYMLFFGRFIYRVVDKSTSFVAEEGLDTRNFAEIMIRFIGVYFLWGIFARLCISLYAGVMLARLKHAPADYSQLVSKTDQLSQYFKGLESNLSRDALIGLIILAGLAFYFLKYGKLVIDLFHTRWLPVTSKAPAACESSSPADSSI